MAGPSLQPLIPNRLKCCLHSPEQFPTALLMEAPDMQGQTGRMKPRALRHLANEQLGLVIQEGQHNPVDDARATLYLYLKHKKAWEASLTRGRHTPHMSAVKDSQAHGRNGGVAFAELARADYMADL